MGFGSSDFGHGAFGGDAETLRTIYTGAIIEYLNNDFGGLEPPISVQIAIDKIMSIKNAGININSWPSEVKKLLLPHKKMRIE